MQVKFAIYPEGDEKHARVEYMGAVHSGKPWNAQSVIDVEVTDEQYEQLENWYDFTLTGNVVTALVKGEKANAKEAKAKETHREYLVKKIAKLEKEKTDTLAVNPMADTTKIDAKIATFTTAYNA